jgi:hypothetical protein
LKTRNILVDSQKGVVTLTGTVNSDMEKMAAENIVRQAPGVTQVIDQLTISAPATIQASTPVEASTSTQGTGSSTKSKKDRHIKASSEAMIQSKMEPQPLAPMPSDPEPVPAETASEQVFPLSLPQAPAPDEATVPPGTVVTVRLIDSVDSSVNQAGQEFAASLETPLVAGDKVLIQRGAEARLRLANVASAGRVKGRSELHLELVSINANGSVYPVQSDYYQKQGSSRGKQTGATIGGAAGLGALIGAAAGGGKGAAIGAGIGAAGGGVVTAVTKGQQVKIASETRLDFTLTSPLTVLMTPLASPYVQQTQTD